MICPGYIFSGYLFPWSYIIQVSPVLPFSSISCVSTVRSNHLNFQYALLLITALWPTSLVHCLEPANIPFSLMKLSNTLKSFLTFLLQHREIPLQVPGKSWTCPLSQNFTPRFYWRKIKLGHARSSHRTCFHNYEKPVQEGMLDGTDVHC